MTVRGISSVEIKRWINLYLAVLSGVDFDLIDEDQTLGSFDLDSVDAVQMALEFERAFEIEIDPELLLDGTQTLAEVADMFASYRLNARASQAA